MRHTAINSLITRASRHSFCKGQLSLFINVSGDVANTTQMAKQPASLHSRAILLPTQGRHKTQQQYHTDKVVSLGKWAKKMPMKKINCSDKYSDNVRLNYSNCSAKNRLYIQCYEAHRGFNRSVLCIRQLCILILHLLCRVHGDIIILSYAQLWRLQTSFYTNQTCGFYIIPYCNLS